MPNQHGHALSLQLLQQRQGGLPVIVVHTTVDNPRLTKDLIMRGVDDVVYKPAQYEVFAAKMRALVKRQAQRKRETPVEGQESESLTAQDT
jgi:DNA-binding response OmpR family regulator